MPFTNKDMVNLDLLACRKLPLIYTICQSLARKVKSLLRQKFAAFKRNKELVSLAKRPKFFYHSCGIGIAGKIAGRSSRGN